MKSNPKYKRVPLKFESLSAGGASEIAKRIVEVWAQRGSVVSAWREEIPGMPGAWQVRSNLRGGVPARG